MRKYAVKNPTIPSFMQALACVSGMFVIVFLSLFRLHIELHSVMLMSIIWVIFHAYYLDKNLLRLQTSMKLGIQKSLSVFLIFILIGAVIAAFTASGAIPTLIYYGLNFISPNAFLSISMILCSVMSLAIGTCWGTIGTMGIALMGVATLFHIPLPMAAGAIVSGAYFGDKFSPISDTTILSALTTQTNLYKHIQGMSYSIIPAYLITLSLFFFLDYQNDSLSTHALSDLTAVQHIITQHFHVDLITLLPMLIMLAMNIKKQAAEISMIASIVVALILAINVQHLSFMESLHILFSGPSLHDTGSIILDGILRHGGIQSMLSSLSLTLLILALGGILEHYGFISVLFTTFIKSLKNPLSLVFTTLWTCVVCNILMGEAYLSIILTSRIFKSAYQRMNLDSCILSKAIEEGCTFSTPLIPWTTSGAFISATLGINAADYMMWSLFNWIAPLVFLIFVAANFFGIKFYQPPPPLPEPLRG
ncbi:MAG: Na+/H+ antiporter NhaC family protein [Legionellaceae bacterium]|nr:Na+/H+ antiporter NhaC family protein [Legionellaceae bacterium]